jgi:hypothetical protein
MPVEKSTGSLHIDERVLVESTPVHIHGHPGITEWHGTIGPVEAELEIGPTYRLRMEDGRAGLIVIKAERKSWGDTPGKRYEFEGSGALM